MDWIESHAALASHPKTKRLTRALGTTKAATIGHLHLLWWWAAEHALDGNLARFDHDDIADAAEWDGDPDTFVKALIECGPRDAAGFLDPDLQLHDWDERTSAYRNASDDGRRGAHRRWHVGGIKPPSPDCPDCVREGLVSVPPADGQPDRVSVPPVDGPTQNTRSNGVPIGGTVPPTCDPNSKTRPNPTGPDLTGQDTTTTPQPPSANRPTAATDGTPRAVVVDIADAITPTSGIRRALIGDPDPGTGRSDYTAQALRHATGALGFAQVLAEHWAEGRTPHRVRSGGVHKLRLLVQDHPPLEVLAALERALVNAKSDDAVISFTQSVLTKATVR